MMMQKYFQIGKNYLQKKLQQYDKTDKQIDYVNEQIPDRLRQPLLVLQQQQIDIEDTQGYENYFKSYPNHHLSHFLLDKYKMMVEAEAEPTGYVLPADVHIPENDKQLENQALLLKEAIEEYDEGFAKNDQPIICLCVINFHHKRGTQIEYRYPQTKVVSDLQMMIVHHAMPDSSHNKSEDFNYFNFQAQFKGKRRMIFGVSYFKQIKLSQNMKKKNPEFTRSYLQKAISVISTVPLFGYLKLKLNITTKLFFQKFTDFNIVQQAYRQLNRHFYDSWPGLPMADLYISTDLKKIISCFQIQDFYEVWKAIIYQRRVVIFGHSSSSVSIFIISLLSLFPGLSTFGIYSKPIAKYMQALRQLALPLRLFSSDNFLSISFHIQDFWHLQRFKKSNKGHFLIGTTNRLLKQQNDYGIELLVNLQDCTVEKRKSRVPWQGLTTRQKKFLSQLNSMVNQKQNLAYEGSEDCIRNHFNTFLKGALIQLIQGIKKFEDFVQKCKQYQEIVKKREQYKQKQQRPKQTQVKKQPQQPQSQNKLAEQQNGQENQKPPLFPKQTKKILLPYLLLNKSFAYFRQFKNESLPEIVSGQLVPSLYINNYDYFLRLSEQQFICYNCIDKKLSFGKGQNIKNFEGKQLKFRLNKNEEGKDILKSIFVGNIQNGKFNKNGFYLDEFQHYEGQYANGIKQGYGKLIIGNEKYIGNFHQGYYQGQGQLINGNDIYVGEFQSGLRHGHGSMQGSFNFEGSWQRGIPIQPAENQQEKKQQKIEQKSIEASQEQIQAEQRIKNQVKQEQEKCEQKQKEVNVEESRQSQEKEKVEENMIKDEPQQKMVEEKEIEQNEAKTQEKQQKQEQKQKYKQEKEKEKSEDN